MNCKTLSRTAAAVLAASISEVFPGSELLGGGETTTGFFYQFFTSQPLPPEADRMLEETMRQIIREDREVAELEMVAFSAKGFFARRDHFAAVNALEELEPKELVSLVKIGDFADLMDGPFCSSVREIGAFRVVALKHIGDCEYRVEGCAFPTKDELKEFLRLLSHYAEENHLERGAALKLWRREGERILWTRRGQQTKDLLVEELRKSICPRGEEFSNAEAEALDRFASTRSMPYIAWTVSEKWADPEGDEGLFEEPCQTIAQQIIYCEEKDFRKLTISLLQSIEKTLIILGFNPELCLTGRRRGEKSLKALEQALKEANGLKVPFKEGTSTSRIQWMVQDGLRRQHAAMELELEEKEGRFLILRAKAAVERILSLLLELKGGELPSWVIPEPISGNVNRMKPKNEQDIQA